MHKTEHSNAERLFEKLEKLYLNHLPEEQRGTRQYRKNTWIYRFGEVPKGIFYIKEGTVKISVIGSNGKEVIIRVATAHDFIGYLSLLKSGSYLTSALVLEDAEVYFIPKSNFLEAIESDSKFAYGVIDLVCDNSLSSTTGLVDLASKNVKQRLCAALLTLDKISSKKLGESGIIRLRKKDISSMIGSVPETVSRHLSELEIEGVIRVYRHYIKIVNRRELMLISNIED